MYRNITDVNTYGDSCVTLPNPDNIIVYNPTADTVITYTLFTDKYVKTYETDFASTPVPVGMTCQDVSVWSQLQSKYDFVLPFYHSLAIFTFIFIVYVSYKLILHPWWRKK